MKEKLKKYYDELLEVAEKIKNNEIKGLSLVCTTESNTIAFNLVNDGTVYDLYKFYTHVNLNQKDIQNKIFFAIDNDTKIDNGSDHGA